VTVFLKRSVLPKALSGGPEGGVNLRAVDRVLAIRDRRARMLGLDATRVQPVLGRRLRELDAAP
jgi:hypothetical protein